MPLLLSCSSSSSILLLSLRFFVVLTFFVSLVNANTEIRNFRVSRYSASSSLTTIAAGEDINVPWILSSLENGLLALEKMNVTHNERTFRIWPASVGTPLHEVCEPGKPAANSEGSGDVNHDASQVKTESRGGMERCPNELWLELDLSELKWRWYDMFTIRISWPAFYPTDFDITLYSPEGFAAYIHTRSPSSVAEDVSDRKASLEDSRLHFARIRLVDTGIRTPSNPSSTTPKVNLDKERREPVPFTITLEPLLFGVLPLTLLPTIYFSIPILVGVLYAFPYVMQYLEGVAEEARKELNELEREKERKKR